MNRARKRFGQHFLHDAAVIDRIVDAIDPRPDDALVEIGPGLGALTWPVLERCGHLCVIEFDRDLAHRLRQAVKRGAELNLINQVEVVRDSFESLLKLRPLNHLWSTDALALLTCSFHPCAYQITMEALP